jgi:hypothetical protein
MADPVAPSRDKLRMLFPNHDDLVAFERLFQRVGDILPNDLESAIIEAGIAGSQAVQALSAVSSLKDALDRLADSFDLLALSSDAAFIPDDDPLPSPVEFSSENIIPFPLQDHAFAENYNPTLNPIRIVESDFTLKGNLELPKAPGIGLKVDVVNPTFGWRDLLGEINPRSTGPGRPTLSVFRGGSTREFAFSAGDEMDFSFHVPHDYVPGTDVFSHVHWAHNGTAISGNIVWDFFTTYSKGHGQAAFPAEKNLTLTYSTVNIATTPRYQHRIDEIQLSVPGGSATEIDTDLLEPDGVILMHINQTTIPAITGGSPNDPFILFVDIHYQSTGMATKKKSPDFYT